MRWFFVESDIVLDNDRGRVPRLNSKRCTIKNSDCVTVRGWYDVIGSAAVSRTRLVLGCLAQQYGWLVTHGEHNAKPA